MDEFTIMGVECTSFDLTYPLSESTIFWPNGEGFNLCMTCSTDGGLHYAAGTFACAEHCGTHVDAPFHFAAHGATVDLIPLRNLVSKCRVIDVSAKCSIETSGNYAVTHDDICEHESIYGPIEPASTVLIRTGWSQHYASGAKVYLGYDESEQGPYSVETSSLHFPGIGEDAAHILVARKVVAVGLDTASLDPGSSKDFAVHRILLGAGIYGIENISSSINYLPVTGATIFVMPMKIVGGSGSPARVMVTVPKVAA